ncbi:hypothetical protein PGQ11_008275 [Apiospora arundinis]|uniref:Homeobox domain-containing protein n=1 Tax=Apiospora arundinis TaxID=335852 RepID=A0ABR2IFR0_9PEZI
MAFTQQDGRFIDFIRMLYTRAPNLNSAQILERCRANFGRLPSMQVQNWLHKSRGERQRAREEVEWRRPGMPMAASTSAPIPESSPSENGIFERDVEKEKKHWLTFDGTCPRGEEGGSVLLSGGHAVM